MSAFTAKDYAALLQYFRTHSDEKYRRFNESLMPGTTDTYGIRAPMLRRLAEDIVRSDWQGYLALAAPNSHEERMLQGMIIARAPCAAEEKLAYLRDFIPRINNWAVCDKTADDCKWREEDLCAVWQFLEPLLHSTEPYAVRFALVLLLDYFHSDAWIDRALEAYRSVKHEDYYVKMALAWGLSMFFVHQREKTLPLFEQKIFDPWVHNKGIQKCRESLRVSAEDKAYLNTLKIDIRRNAASVTLL